MSFISYNFKSMRGLKELVLTVLWIVFIFPFDLNGAVDNGTSTGRGTHSSASLSRKAQNCKARLLHSGKKKYRSNWLNCISLDERLYRESTGEEGRLQAVSDLVVLYHQLGRLSGKKSDFSREDYWKNILSGMKNHPGSASSAVSTEEGPPGEPKETILNLRSWNHGDYIRVVLDLNSSVAFETHENPESRTLTVDFFKTTVRPEMGNRSFPLNDKEMKAEFKQLPGRVQLSLLNNPYKKYKVTQLVNPLRWVMDLSQSEGSFPPGEETASAVPPPKKTLRDLAPANPGIHKIIIDPGHGGKDPGAIGLSGFAEKEAVLDIGLKLKELVVKQLGINVIMTRSRDVFIPLEERTRMANEANADLFISIHANSSPHRNTHGIEIYLLGQSSDKRALRTAARENNSTEAEATNLDKNLLSIKKDLLQEYKKGESLEFAHITRSSFMNVLRPSYPIVDLGVKTAPFYVLMNTAMPSILAEVSFISNPAEEQRLKTRTYRQKMAESLFEGIKKYISAGIPESHF